MNTTSSESERTPLLAADLSAFAKVLRAQLAERMESGAGLPGHVEMLNLLARAAGHRNVQALKAAARSTTSAAPAPQRWHGPKPPALSPAGQTAPTGSTCPAPSSPSPVSSSCTISPAATGP